MAESAVSSVLGRISILLLESANSDVMRNQIQSLGKDLEEIRLHLKDAVSRRDTDQAIFRWITGVEDLAYRIEDAIDILSLGSQTDRFKQSRRFREFAAHLGLPGTLFLSFARTLPLAIHDTMVTKSFLRELRDIKSMGDSLMQRLKLFGLERFGLNDKIDWKVRRLTDSYASDWGDFVGMEADRKRLVSCLFDDAKHGQVISLCGTGGTGKTVLARWLFNDTSVQNYFECFAWVCVGQKFQCADIWRSVARQLSRKQREEIVDLDDMDLHHELYIVLKEKRCLVVLDDIWSMDAWKRLSIIFPFGEMNGKVILTTRMREIAEMASEKRFLHLMPGLTDEESWQLFKTRALRTEDPDPEIEMIGRNIVKECAGLPLAILVLGGIMRIKSVEGWKRIEASLKKGETFGDHEIVGVLNLSYDNLPYYLKPCFLYLGLFPRGSYIDAEKLYLLWVAEGLILSKKYGLEETNIDVAERYLGELVLQSLVEVQEEEVPMFRRFKSCRLNELMWGKCLWKGKEENFLKIIDYGSENEQARDFDSISFNSTTRRVAICKHEDRDVSGGIEMDKRLRCLLQLNVKYEGELLPVQISNLAELKSLRILDFDGFDFGQTGLPGGLENLVRLRYLSFKSCLLEELPLSIGNLCSLQILDLRVRSCIELKIPNVLSKLVNLMHLFLPESLCTLHGGKLKLDGLTLLETLENFDTRICSIGDLLELKQLRCLTTTVQGSLEDLQGIISRMTVTTDCILHSSVEIRNFDCYTDERSSLFGQLLKSRALFVLRIQGRLEHILPYNEISPCLMEINLNGSKLEEDPFTTLEKLPSLRILVLRNDAFLGEKMVCSASGFRELRRLELSNLRFLKEWMVEGGAMPQLKALTIEKCEKLGTVPDGFRSILSNF